MPPSTKTPSSSSSSSSSPPILSLTFINAFIPASRHYLLVCLSGSKGYRALKEMLQNGYAGHCLLLESSSCQKLLQIDSHDMKYQKVLKDVVDFGNFLVLALNPHDNTLIDEVDFEEYFKRRRARSGAGGGGGGLRLSLLTNARTLPNHLLYGCSSISTLEVHLPPNRAQGGVQVGDSFLSGCSNLTNVINLSAFSDTTNIGCSFLNGCKCIVSFDDALRCFSKVQVIEDAFLRGCSGLLSLSLRGVCDNITVVERAFLSGCSGLKSLDLSPLRHVQEVQGAFLSGCSGLTSIDLTPLSQLTKVDNFFLQGCSGLLEVDLSPLSKVTEIGGAFLAECRSLTSIDLKPLSLITEVPGGFLRGCSGLPRIDASPLVRLVEPPTDLQSQCSQSTPVVYLTLPSHFYS